MTPALLIRRARRDAGLTQGELASRMGTAQSTVARLEQPGSNPTIVTLEAALHAAGRRLELATSPAGGVDETQILERLKLSPGERLATFQRSQHSLARMARGARRVA